MTREALLAMMDAAFWLECRWRTEGEKFFAAHKRVSSQAGVKMREMRGAYDYMHGILDRTDSEGTWPLHISAVGHMRHHLGGKLVQELVTHTEKKTEEMWETVFKLDAATSELRGLFGGQ